MPAAQELDGIAVNVLVEEGRSAGGAKRPCSDMGRKETGRVVKGEAGLPEESGNGGGRQGEQLWPHRA